MKILALDTSGPVCGVAVSADGALRYEGLAVNKRTHSVNLLPMAEEALLRAELTLGQMDALAVVIGPGSFTGVRIGVSVAKGMAHGAKLPCVAVDALEALAAGACESGAILCPIQDARAGQVYGAAFRAGWPPERLMEDAALKLPEYLQRVAALGERLLFMGDGVATYRAQIAQALGERAVFAPPHQALLRPGSVALLAELRADSSVDYLALQPLYLRAPQAERARLARGSAEC